MKSNSITRYLKNDQPVYSLEECDSVEIELHGENTDNLYALVSKESLSIIYDYCWYISKSGYPIGYPSGLLNKKERNKLAVGIKMHKLIIPHVKKGFVIDHINRNRRDNRLHNLRVCTRKENSYNTSKPKNSKYTYKGVKMISDCIWKATITKDNKRYEINDIPTEQEAALIYDAMAEELFGKFAGKNFE